MFRFGDPGGRMYNTAVLQTLPLWSSTTGNNAYWSVVASGGRSGGSCLRLTVTATNTIRFLSVALSSQVTWGIAFAFKSANAPSAAQPLFSLYDSGTLQCDLRLNTDYSLSVTRGGTTIGTSSIFLSINTWTHIEWKTTINNSTGTTEVRINGITALTFTGNTRMTSNNSANTIAIGNVTATNLNNNALTFDWDDIIVYDGQANDPQGNPDINDFIGDCGLAWSLPTGAGTTTQFTPDSGSNYARVQETVPDGNTSYVEDNVVGHIDTYAMANLPASATGVKSTAVVTYAEKTDIGTRSFCAEIRTNSMDFAGALSQSPGNSYLYYFNNWGRNPSGTPTPTPWTVIDINAIEAGQKILT